jgi:hypothetical protein
MFEVSTMIFWMIFESICYARYLKEVMIAYDVHV